MKKKYLITSIIIFFINIPFLFLDLFSCNIIITIISFFYFLKYMLYDINILNNDCDPKNFFEKNKNNHKQNLNNCFAILHMYNNDEYNQLFLSYFEKAKQKKIKNNLYKMKLDYLYLNYKLLNNEDYETELQSFETKWSNNNFLSLKEQKYIKNFIKNKKPKCMLDSIINHFEKANLFLENGMKELAKSEFEYVEKYGGTTIYKKIASNNLLQLKEYSSNKKIKKDYISFKNKYLCNKYVIDTSFCIYIILFIFIIILGGFI